MEATNTMYIALDTDLFRRIHESITDMEFLIDELDESRDLMGDVMKAMTTSKEILEALVVVPA
jgi:hypothetical protein